MKVLLKLIESGHLAVYGDVNDLSLLHNVITGEDDLDFEDTQYSYKRDHSRLTEDLTNKNSVNASRVIERLLYD